MTGTRTEETGFEPARGSSPLTGLANRRLSSRPPFHAVYDALGHEGSNLDRRGQNPQSFRLNDVPSIELRVHELLGRGSNPHLRFQRPPSCPLDDRAPVGAVRIELTTLGLKTRCASWLRHAPELEIGGDREESNLHLRGKSPLIFLLTYSPISRALEGAREFAVIFDFHGADTPARTHVASGRIGTLGREGVEPSRPRCPLRVPTGLPTRNIAGRLKRQKPGHLTGDPASSSSRLSSGSRGLGPRTTDPSRRPSSRSRRDGSS